MKLFTNSQAAERLGISAMSLGRYVKAKKVPAPRMFQVGSTTLHGWTEEEVENLRKLLPKIANGRKTRYQKLREKQKTPARVPAPHKNKTKKKKK